MKGMTNTLFHPTEMIINRCAELLESGYHRTYGNKKSDYAEILSWAASMALENIANTDALYHNVEHTISVALVGQEILRGKHIREGGVSCEDWLNFMISLLCHDIGYVRGVCQQDRVNEGFYAMGVDSAMLSLPPGSTDASLAPYHVDRGKLFVEERFWGHKLIDIEVVKCNIELTRFPVPVGEEHKDTINYPGLVRAADLIGQLADPRYLQKMSALFYEFEEIGANKRLGYCTPGDLRQNYPAFYWNVILPYIQPALGYLDLTLSGKQIVANLYANVFKVEHSPRTEQWVSCHYLN